MNNVSDKRRDMKNRLEIWGSANELCIKKQEEIKRVKRLIRQAGDIKCYSLTGMPKSGKISDPTYKAVELIIDEYEKEISNVAESLEKILHEKNTMDMYIDMLSPKEAKILFYKYRKKVSPESLAIIMNLSRSHSYRILNNTIDKLIEMVPQ